jgi:hypothetical protein
MLSKHFAILALLAGLPALAQGPAAAVSPSTTPIHLRRHAPMKLSGVPLPGAVTSTNWSGYAATGTGFTKVLGSWIVPKVNCSKTPNTYSSYWVGLDGYSNSTVEQIGTDSDCSGSTGSYYAWYEFYPNPLKVLPGLAVSPGNKMSATVAYASGQFTLRITNHTTGKAVKVVKNLSSPGRTSAEWIVEAPSSGAVLPLADFTSVSLGTDYTGVNDTDWAVNGKITGPISDFGSSVQKITMETSGGTKKAVPTALTTDGSSFKVTWKHE